MNLVLDIGNTRTKVSVFDHRRLEGTWVYDLPEPDDIKELASKYPMSGKAIISSTREFPEGLLSCLKDTFSYVLELDETTPVPVTVKYSTPATLGKDRLAAVVGANFLYPGTNILVVDAGTAVTFDFVNSDGEYLGGNISPGLSMRFSALNYFTGRLPMVQQKAEFDFWGTDTESAIRAGVQNGILFEVESYIRHFKKIYRKMNVIFTGGDVNFFESKLKNYFFVNSNLVATGLNRILEYNDKKL